MSAASEQIGFDRNKLLLDEEVWEGTFGRLVKDCPESADCVADVLFRILQAATTGREGIERAAHTLRCGIRWVYQYTGAHNLSFEAYLRYLDGLMLNEDEPEQLMRDAINRGLSRTKPSPRPTARTEERPFPNHRTAPESDEFQVVCRPLPTASSAPRERSTGLQSHLP